MMFSTSQIYFYIFCVGLLVGLWTPCLWEPCLAEENRQCVIFEGFYEKDLNHYND